MENDDSYAEPMLAARYEGAVLRLYDLADDVDGDPALSALRRGVFDLDSVSGGESRLSAGLRLLETAEARGSTSFETLWMIGVARYRLGRYAAALEAFDRTAEIHHSAIDNPVFQFSRFEAARAAGEFSVCKEALEWFCQIEVSRAFPERRDCSVTSITGQRVGVVLMAPGPGDVLRSFLSLQARLQDAASVRVFSSPRFWPLLRAASPTVEVTDDLTTVHDLTLVAGSRSLERSLDSVDLDQAVRHSLLASDVVAKAKRQVLNAIPEMRDRPVLFHWRTTKPSRRRMAKCATLPDFRPLLEDDGAKIVCLQHSVSPHERAWLATHFPGVIIAEDRLNIFDDVAVLLALVSYASAVFGPGLTGTELAAVAGVPTYGINVDERWRQGSDGRDLYFPNLRHVSRNFAEPAKPSVARAVDLWRGMSAGAAPTRRRRGVANVR